MFLHLLSWRKGGPLINGCEVDMGAPRSPQKKRKELLLTLAETVALERSEQSSGLHCPSVDTIYLVAVSATCPRIYYIASTGCGSQDSWVLVQLYQ